MSTPGSESDHWWVRSATILSESWDFYENRLLEIKFYDVSLCQMSSLVIPDTLGSLHTCPDSLQDHWFWWFLVDFCVRRWGECFAPLSSAGWVPQVSYGQIVFKRRILDINYNDFWRTFQLCPPQVLNTTTNTETQPRFCQNLEISMRIDFLKSSFMKSSDIKYPPWWLLIPQEVSLRDHASKSIKSI